MWDAFLCHIAFHKFLNHAEYDKFRMFLDIPILRRSNQLKVKKI